MVVIKLFKTEDVCLFKQKGKCTIHFPFDNSSDKMFLNFNSHF